MKTCTKCGESKPIDGFSPAKQCRDGRRPECKTCHNVLEKARQKEHRTSGTRAYKRAERMRRLFGITVAEYDELLTAQGGRCAICPAEHGEGFRQILVVDHDHTTGAVRALLCHNCNTAMGLMRDDPERLRSAAEYVEAHRLIGASAR